MNWDAIGAIAELLGAGGVIGSLLYVASQVRASTTASRVESKLRMTDYMVQFGDMLIQNPDLNKLMILGRQGIDTLSKDDYFKFSNLAQKFCWYMSGGYFMYKEKTISEDDWFELKSIITYWTKSKGFQQWWTKQGKGGFTGRFATFIEGEIDLAKQSAAK